MLNIDLQKVKDSLFEAKFPLYVIVEPTNVCNLNCIMCPNDIMPRKRDYMKFDLFKKIVDEIAEKSPKTKLWPAIMGEPLLHPDLKNMLKYAVEKGIDVVLNTNGNLIDDEWIDFLANSGIRELIIGIDAFSEETYSKVRVNGDYKKIHDNIIKMLSIFKNNGPRLILQYIVMPENENEVEDFKNYWLPKGAILKVRPKQGWGKHIKTDLPLEQEDRNMPCPWLIRTFMVLCDGTLCQCDGDACEALGAAGNLNNTTIEEMWNGEFRKRRERHWNLDFDFVPCNTCKDWQLGLSEFYYPENYDQSNLIIRDITNIQFKDNK